MHSNLSGPTKVVCYREVFTIREFVMRGFTVTPLQLNTMRRVAQVCPW